MNSFEVYQDPDGQAQFYFSHSDKQFTTGVLVLHPGKELAKHNRPLAVENLIQIAGKCVMKVYSSETEYENKALKVGDSLSMAKGVYHIHSNPFQEISVTFFKAEGDITKIMDNLRKALVKIK
ncbi:MAG: hypothetical protein UY13_C0002G0006 [Candidatus Pacebacteria bacterium GW2011_GWB1_47_8]|nr:MAG: hypothetical protein UX28_C0001G0154 [Candidatus Pacebacteria bacterium GW2011_GWA1_46_10]KKU84094.1 MAG: hypothetical protein UY13_C0002G0006 [Candidatus Pacebacteria bacterium GW2011_GWB1_47_8]HCR81537.1 hypothetical protein [Candidatus Paceibacterota bacterium]